MSSEPLVRARGLGKKFRLYDRPGRHLAAIALGAGGGRDHWALRDVDLDLRPGDCLGIVGRNGAGKSTLLELICGIRPPSEGSVETRGRIAALLQLGAGFSPEFTGRENVFLAAALYGLSAEQTRQRFAAIVDFAGIGKAVDRPVREYSSGMYARLAFSLCAHVDADILVVDEILGVGDVRFQQQSMRFLRNFRKRGIVLFVSHNEHAVAALCGKAVWIDGGRIAASGATRDVLYRYRREASRLMGPHGSFSASAGEDGPAPIDPLPAATFGDGKLGAFDPDDIPAPTGDAVIESTALTLAGGGPAAMLGGGERLRLAVACKALRPIGRPRLIFTLRNPMGQIVFSGDSGTAGGDGVAALAQGDIADFEFRFALPYLPTGSYPVDVAMLSDGPAGILCHAAAEAAAVVNVLSQHVSSGHANIRMDRTVLLVGPEVS